MTEPSTLAAVDAAPLSGSALRLVETAERLFAVHGLDGISLRQIAAEAGSSNHSAVRYHFKSKEGLVRAIFEHRVPQIIRERRLLRSRCAQDDLWAVLEAHLLPVLALAEAPDNRYMTFVEQVQRRQPRDVLLSSLPPELHASNAELHEDLDRLLEQVDPRLRRIRIADVQMLGVHAAVDRESAVANGDSVVGFDLFVSSLVDGIAAYLTAPASKATAGALGDEGR